jgi:hypothetical protein
VEHSTIRRMSSSSTQPAPVPYNSQQSPATPGAAPRKSRTRTIVLAIVGAIVLILLFVAGVVAAVFGIMKSSDVYQQAVQVATHDPRATAALGSPITPSWFLSGNISVAGPSGSADLAIPVSGTQHKGTIYVVAKKEAGRWRYQTLELAVDGQEQRIDLSASPQPAEQ